MQVFSVTLSLIFLGFWDFFPIFSHSVTALVLYFHERGDRDHITDTCSHDLTVIREESLSFSVTCPFEKNKIWSSLLNYRTFNQWFQLFCCADLLLQHWTELKQWFTAYLHPTCKYYFSTILSAGGKKVSFIKLSLSNFVLTCWW